MQYWQSSPSSAISGATISTSALPGVLAAVSDLAGMFNIGTEANTADGGATPTGYSKC